MSWFNDFIGRFSQENKPRPQKLANFIDRLTPALEKVDGLVRVEVEYQRSYEAHFTSRVLKDDLGVIGQTAETVGRPDHRHVVHVHLCHSHHFRSREALRIPTKSAFTQHRTGGGAGRFGGLSPLPH